MPENKNAAYRYRIIDECLRNTGRKWKLENIIQFVSERLRVEEGVEKGISKRSIQYDLQRMQKPKPEGFEAPIVCIDGFYSYAHPDFSIYNLPVAEDDLLKLKQAVAVLEQIKGLHFFDELEPIINNLSRKIETNVHGDYKIIEFEHRPETKGEEYLGDIYKSILQKNALKIAYMPFNSIEKSSMIIHPYLLKEYNSRWFLLGLDEQIMKVKNLALDRIDEIKVSGAKYIENKFIDFNDYFKNIVGVTLPLDAKIESIEIKVKNTRAPYISTKPIHYSQAEVVKKDYTHFTFKLIPNRELLSTFLSFGNDLEVIKPISLRDQIKEIVNKANHIYHG